MKPSADRAVSGALAGSIWICAAFILFVARPIVSTQFSQRLGIAAMIASGIAAAWCAGAVARRIKNLRSARRILLGVTAGTVVGLLTLTLIGLGYYLVAGLYFLHSNFQW